MPGTASPARCGPDEDGRLIRLHGQTLAIEHRGLASALAFGQRRADLCGRRSIAERPGDAGDRTLPKLADSQVGSEPQQKRDEIWSG